MERAFSTTASHLNELSVWLTEDSLVNLLGDVGFEQLEKVVFPAREDNWWSDRREGRVLYVAHGLVKRDDASVEGHQNESELYRKIIRRAKGIRERAAESLRRSRAVRKRQGDLGEQADVAQRRRRIRRQD